MRTSTHASSITSFTLGLALLSLIGLLPFFVAKAQAANIVSFEKGQPQMTLAYYRGGGGYRYNYPYRNYWRGPAVTPYGRGWNGPVYQCPKQCFYNRYGNVIRCIRRC